MLMVLGSSFATRYMFGCSMDSTRVMRRHSLTIGTAGRYTDDTQMSIAIAEALIAGGEWTPSVLADHFVNSFKRDPRPGYAPRFSRLLKHVESGEEFLRVIKPQSSRSGAAIHAGPIGLLDDEATVVAKATMQARITHDTPEGIASAVAAALMVHYFQLDLGGNQDLRKYIASRVAGPWETNWSGRVGMNGIACVSAAMTSIVSTSSYEEVLRRCISWGGDTDTVAAIAMAAVSRSRHHVNDLPQNLIDQLERGAYGQDFLIELDQRLHAAFPRD